MLKLDIQLFGGRGASSSSAGRGASSRAASLKSKLATVAQKAASAEAAKKLPTRGKKVQESYIDYVKKQTNIDLSKARDPQFDNQKGFNIDVTKLGKNDLSAIKSLQRQYPGGYDVQIMENGANRKFIQVTRRQNRR